MTIAQPVLTENDRRILDERVQLVSADITKLSPHEILDRVQYLPLSMEEELLVQFVEKFTAVWGRKGTGKTMISVSICHGLKENFGIKTVSDVELTEKFGDYTYINIDRFIDQIRFINELTKGQSETIAKNALTKQISNGMVDSNGVSLMSSIEGAALILDEAYNYLDARESQSRLVKLVGHWISQMRHYRVSLFLITPHLDMIDKRARRQIDISGECYTDPMHMFDGNRRIFIPPSHRTTLAVFHDLGDDVKFQVETNVGRGGQFYGTFEKRAFRSKLTENDYGEDHGEEN